MDPEILRASVTVVMAMACLVAFHHVVSMHRNTTKKIDAIFDAVTKMAEQNERREAALERLVGGFEAVVGESRRMAQSCEQMAERTQESVAAVVAVQQNASKMVSIVDNLARQVMDAEIASKSGT